MIKAKKFNWKDTNVALFGSDLDKGVKKEAAQGEPAWENAGSECGLQIWRIVNFKVTRWTKSDYGKFYENDSYIILNTFKENGKKVLKYDVHFWIGKYSSQDEYGTAAYKTVELDAFLDDKATQHREVMKFESNLFKSYFHSITYLKGGAESGFNHVEPSDYKSKLFHYKQVGNEVTVKEVSLCKESLHSNDVFLLDMGLRIIQWNGSSSSGTEKYTAAKYIQELENERPNMETKVIDEFDKDENAEFHSSLTGQMEEDDDMDMNNSQAENILYKLSDSSGVMRLSEVKSGGVHKDDFHSDDVFFVDCGNCLLVWIGSGSSIEERRNALARAHELLKTSDHPLVPVSVYSENDNRFWDCLMSSQSQSKSNDKTNESSKKSKKSSKKSNCIIS